MPGGGFAPIASAADPTQCWDTILENQLCDGPCIVLAPCATAVTWDTRFADNDTSTLWFVVKDPNATTNDDGDCMQQNEEFGELQTWGCPPNNRSGQAWAFEASSQGFGYQLIDTWRPEGESQCICPGVLPSPSPSPVPLPQPLHTCACVAPPRTRLPALAALF